MATAKSSGNNGFMYFLVGVLLVAVIGFAAYYYAEGGAANDRVAVEISIDENGIEIDGN